MLSTRSDYDKDSSEFMDELRQLELDKSPPSWLPARMQQKSAAAQDTSADLQDLAQGSQLNAHNADSADTSSIQEHESPPVHSEAPSPPYPPSPITMQNPEDAPVAVQLSSEGADIDLDDRPDHELTLEERDMRNLLDPILDDAFDMEAWPSLSKTVSATHHRAKPHQQERDQRESLRPQENPTAAQTSPIARHLQSTGWKAALDRNASRDQHRATKIWDEMYPGLSAAKDLGWGSPDFFKMGREKIKLLEVFTSMGYDVLLSDVDTLWLKNPLPYVGRYPEADILFASDNLRTSSEGEELEDFRLAASAGNIGILFFRATALPFVQEWNAVLADDDLYWDQNAFNDLFRRGLDFSEEHRQRLFKGYDGRLWMGTLPVSIFCNGHTFFVQRLHESLKVDPYVIHTVFQFSGTPGKRHRLREERLWNDPPEYYDPPGGLMSFDLKIQHLLADAAPKKFDGQLEDFDGHFALVNHELVQVRSALIIAAKLNRTIIMPQLWCGADRWWAPHDGHIPPTQFPLPFPCPMDHIFDLEQMQMELPEADFGSKIRFRESSFLASPNLPPSVRHSQLIVQPCHVWYDMFWDIEPHKDRHRRTLPMPWQPLTGP
ncbi:hypothetical protein WJX84_002857 [Apatococcus fuscideae]|uniref:Nucleotide-diphospho-sugar transferase domain-containing protein n=1 Tax=Apatococcus fuscideae TaxID=2026836 RepID=A0AAW1SWM1_9CHLO